MELTFSRGTIYDKNRVYITAYFEKEEGTRIFRRTTKWDNYYVPFVTGGICSVFKPQPEILTLGVGGQVHSAGPGGFSNENIDDSKEGPAHRGILRAIKLIDKTVYVTGMGRQVYKKRSHGNWIRCDNGVLDPLGSKELVGFESIDGFSNSEIYAVGLGGEIWFYNGILWEQIESPTNLVLESVLCSPDGYVYIAGQLGLIIKGRKHFWQVVEQDITEDTFWDLAWFQDRLWLSSANALFCLKDNDFKKVEFSLDSEPTCRYLDADDGVLWSFGAKNLMCFDGKAWTEIQKP